MPKKENNITPSMTVLDSVIRYRKTEEVFKKYDEKANTCICCHALFDTIEEVSDKYGIDLATFLDDLERASDR